MRMDTPLAKLLILGKNASKSSTMNRTICGRMQRVYAGRETPGTSIISCQRSLLLSRLAKSSSGHLLALPTEQKCRRSR